MRSGTLVMCVPRLAARMGALCRGDCHRLVEFIIWTLPETKSEPDPSSVRTSNS